MAEHNDLGNRAEMLASQWLQHKGYVLLAQKYRFKHAEIDLIMEYIGLLIFVEVKDRSGTGFGYAEEFVDFSKEKLLVKASVAYVHEIDWHKKILFEIVGVYKVKHGNINFRQFDDVFY